MNKSAENFLRNEIKDGLDQLTEKHHEFFKRMYSFDDLAKPINDVVDQMPVERLDWALTQVENSLAKAKA